MGFSEHAPDGNFAGSKNFQAGDFLLFGPERSAFPPLAVQACDSMSRIPVTVGSLNLAVSVGVGVYEAVRQIDNP